MTIENHDTMRENPASFPPEIGRILKAIEQEPVPERLLTLARALQEALAKRRAAGQSTQTAGPIHLHQSSEI